MNTENYRPAFVPKCWDAPYLHHLLAGDDWSKPWTADSSDKAVEFLDDTLGFDIEKWTELLGSAHLIVPNPWLRDVRQVLSEEADELTVALDARTNADVSSLQMTVWEDRASGVSHLYEGPVDSGRYVSVDVPKDLKEVGVHITVDDGVVYRSEPSAFVSSVQINMSAASPRRIRVDDSRGTEEFEAPTYIDEEIVVGEPPEPGGSAILKAGERRRELMESAREEQYWFDGDTKRAKNLVRDLIRDARERVLIVDSYFGGPELSRFGPVASRESVTVKILTSWMYLRRDVDREDDLNSAEQSRTKKEKLQDTLETLRETVKSLTSWLFLWSDIDRNDDSTLAEQSGTEKEKLQDTLETLRKEDFGPYEIRVLEGREQSPIHDRFLVIDDEAWLLGSSFNKFGNRGTMLVKLHRPKPVIDILMDYWESDKTRPLEVAGDDSRS
jgi:hypothetical protein